MALRGGACAVLLSLSAAASPEVTRDHTQDSMARFRHEMGRTVRADHPAIVPVAAAIRAVTTNPLEQLVLVNDVTHLLVDYDSDQRVYGHSEFHATLDEMIARRRAAGWVYLRDDCDGRAVFAAHLLASLGIPWRLEASYWQRHAWVVARVNGVDYDLLDSGGAQPDPKDLAYRLIGRHFVHAENPPPYFRWREAWAGRTGRNLEIGKRLGLLELESTAADLRERDSVDWLKAHPEGKRSPLDPHMLLASTAGFPLGEPLHPASGAGALAVQETVSDTNASATASASIAIQPR